MIGLKNVNLIRGICMKRLQSEKEENKSAVADRNLGLKS